MKKSKLSLITPGEILSDEFLIPNNLSMAQLAKGVKVSSGRITQIVHNQREITADTAYRLSKFFGTSPQFWLNLQSNYNLRAYEETWASMSDQIETLRAA